MQVLVHVAVFECIVGSFLGGVDRGVEMLQLGGKAHADFKWIRHITNFFIDESSSYQGRAHTSTVDAAWR